MDPEHEAELVRRYKEHRKNIRRRGLGWEWDLEGWRRWWAKDGRWARRGPGPDAVVMALRNPEQPCGPRNAVAKTRRQHSSDVNRRTFADPEARDRLAARVKLSLSLVPKRPPRRDGFPSRPCVTPLGRFPSRARAAEAHGVSTTILLRRIRQGLPGYRDGDGSGGGEGAA